ncbi:interleukin-13 receptor subunit alpha-1 isoform 2-T2 [Anableps anableps]
MFQCLEFFVLTCLFLAAKTTTGQILPPQNLSLHWKDEFNPELTWEPPLHSMANCVYEGEIRSNKQKYQTASFSTSNRSFSELMYMEGGFCHYSLRTVCGNNQSEPAVLEISYPELVKMLDCYVYAAKQTHCSWSSVWNDTDLRFFYQLRTNFVDGPPAKLQECSSYNYTDDVKSGCNLPASSQMSIGMFFNATLNNTVVWNSFSQNRLKVKPPAPTWTVKESKDQFSINWIPPDILRQDSWAYQITYTECNKQNTVYVEEQTSFVLQRVFNCSYCIWIEANSESGNSPPSDKQCFGTRIIFSPKYQYRQTSSKM